MKVTTRELFGFSFYDCCLSELLEVLENKIEEKEKEAAEASAKALHDMRGKIRDAIKETAEETEDLSDALKQYRGWDGSQGTERKINPEEAFRAASALLDYRNGRKIREIAKLAGRMSTVSLKTKRSKVDAPTIEQWSGVTDFQSPFYRVFECNRPYMLL